MSLENFLMLLSGAAVGFWMVYVNSEFFTKPRHISNIWVWVKKKLKNNTTV